MADVIEVRGSSEMVRGVRPAVRRRLPIGAELVPHGVHFRVWAPRRGAVAVVTEGEPRPRRVALEATGGGYFEGLLEGGEGLRYRYRLDDDDRAYPDPASRFQPEGPHGPSQVVDPARFAWTDAAWRGVSIPGQVIYEMHVGTFTREGTWAAAARWLPELAHTGVTVIEVMPVADFPGRFGWGYDGVNLFAPTRLYGEPDDLRRFVDAAHARGLAVILDVVYNHFGPSGNYLAPFSGDYFTDRHENDWGDAINFDGAGSGPVRELFVANAAYWVEEYHLDGLRLDATQDIHDASPVHVVAELARAARRAARGRSIVIVAENEPQDARLVRPVDRGGMGLDGMWNDDFHHTAAVALTGRREAYYTDYHGTPQELISAVKWGFLYQGQRYSWQKARRGSPALDVPGAACVVYLENHDQVANSARGARLHQLTSPGKYRALTALALLAPGTPMLFQGQEFASSAPFVYFADHEPELARKVAEGRLKFLAQFPSLSGASMKQRVPAPHEPAAFEACRLDHTERAHGEHAQALALHRDLLRLRRTDPVLRRQDAGRLHGAVLSGEAFLLRYTGEGEDRLLVINLGRQLELVEAPEPLLAPPGGMRWETLWSSENPEYGGVGITEPDGESGWKLSAQSAVLLHPVRDEREA